MTVIKLEKLINDLDIITPITKINKNVEITDSELSRPGLELTGYVTGFELGRIQILGTREVNYLLEHGHDTGNLENYLNLSLPLIVFSRNYSPSKEFLDLCEKNDITICVSSRSSSKTQTIMFNYLEYNLAPETTVHGVLISVYNTGVLIKGQSGIGKSELALELINKGHFLIADDAIEIKQTDTNTLIGSAPELLKNRLEIRGLGIVDVQKLYGVTKVLPLKKIDLVVELQQMTGKEDRIGTNIKSEKILDSNIAKIEIPVTMGRSISNLIEVAVANYELKNSYGYDSAKEFVDDLNEILKRGAK